MASTHETSDPHENAAQLIPWLINGTLQGDEAAWLRTHLESCAACRDDFDAERRLYEAIRADGPVALPGEPSLQKLLARIEADEYAVQRGGDSPPAGQHAAGGAPQARGGNGGSARDPRHRGTHRGTARQSADRRARPRAAVRWLTAAVAVEALALGLGAWTWHAGPSSQATLGTAAAPYRTLTTAPPHYGAGARVRIVFRSGLSLDELQKLLESVGAHIVDGPTDARVFTLGFAEPVSDKVLDARIAKLRANPDVLFAEPASGPSR